MCGLMLVLCLMDVLRVSFLHCLFLSAAIVSCELTGVRSSCTIEKRRHCEVDFCCFSGTAHHLDFQLAISDMELKNLFLFLVCLCV